MSDEISEATLRDALRQLAARRGPRDMLVLHPDTHSWATSRGFVEDGVVRWDRIADAYRTEPCTHDHFREEEADGVTFVVCDDCGAQRGIKDEREEP